MLNVKHSLYLSPTMAISRLSSAQGGYNPPSRVWPLIELEFREENERIGLHERKPMVPNFEVSG